MFFRRNLSDLSKWRHQRKRKPLVFRGARQVGKSTLVKEFAKLEKLNLIEINFETTSLPSLKTEEIKVSAIIKDIQLLINRKVSPDTDLIFFDEIQRSPQAFMALRYFYEEYPQLAIVAAGSLLDFLLESPGISVPVGRIEYYYLGPVSFSEYLLAKNKNQILEEYNNSPDKISEMGHKLLIQEWRSFLITGGMPECVQAEIDQADVFDIRKIQKNILNTYRSDFFKYTKGAQPIRCEAVFNYLPGHIGQKVKYSEIDSEEKSKNLKEAIHLLHQARILLPTIHTNATSIPLKAVSDDHVFKLYHLDCGLVSAELLIMNDFSQESPMRGSLNEQFVAQHLAYLNPTEDPQLFYWLKDKSSQKAEIDFIHALRTKKLPEIIPIEVKSNRKAKARSISELTKINPAIKRWIKLSPDPYRKITNDRVMYEVPIYLVERLDAILSG